MAQSLKKILFFIFFGFYLSNCEAQRENKPEKNDSLRKIYQNKFEKYLQKDREIAQHLTISDTSIALFASIENKNLKKPEFICYWKELKTIKNLLENNPQKAFELYESGKSLADNNINKTLLSDSLQKKDKILSGKRIALDPGHIAGDMETAVMEGKYISMTLAEGQKIAFFESELAWYTAKILQEKLQNLGAEVMLTRDAFGFTAFGKTYQDWFEGYAKEKEKKGIKKAYLNKSLVFFQEFTKAEFKERARKINEFVPDLTLIIHYNVDANNLKWQKPTKENNAMAFVAGAFMKNDLEKNEARFNLLRLLLSDDLEKSLAFSKTVLAKTEEKIKVPIIPAENTQYFLSEKSLFTGEKGVYSRNLSLTRMVYGTLCYAEPLYQDNEKECLLLNKKDSDFKGKKIPQRIIEVADAYLEAILKYWGI